MVIWSMADLKMEVTVKEKCREHCSMYDIKYICLEKSIFGRRGGFS